MKRSVAGILFVLVMALVASGLAFADTDQNSSPVDAAGEVNFTAELQFDSAMDNHVELELTNHGNKDFQIFSQAHYMDQLGSAGSWNCDAGKDITVKPGEKAHVEFSIEKTVAHGEQSILAFFFQYDGNWYLGKVGEKNGIEYFLQHN